MTLFSLFNTISGIALIMYNLLQCKKKSTFLGGVSTSAITYFQSKHIRVLSSVYLWAILELAIMSCAQYNCVGFLNTMTSIVMKTGANYFGILYFAPIVVVLACWLLKIDPLAQLDLITPAYPLALFFAKIACHFGGCCRGIVWEKGMFNPITRQIEFPAPLLEATVALLLFVFLFSCRNKIKKGRIFPIYLISFSAIRFFTEFLRCEPEVLWGLKTYHFLCIVGVILGMFEYFVVNKYGSCISEKFANHTYSMKKTKL